MLKKVSVVPLGLVTIVAIYLLASGVLAIPRQAPASRPWTAETDRTAPIPMPLPTAMAPRQCTNDNPGFPGFSQSLLEQAIARIYTGLSREEAEAELAANTALKMMAKNANCPDYMGWLSKFWGNILKFAPPIIFRSDIEGETISLANWLLSTIK